MQIQSMTFKEGIICFSNLINQETFVTGLLTGCSPTYFPSLAYGLES